MKRLFPAKYSASMTKTPRFDAPKAAVYNSQRSKATVGGGGNTEHNFNSNFLKEEPRTRSPHVHWRKWRKYRFEDVNADAAFTPRGQAIIDMKQLMAVETKDLFSLYRVWQGKRRQGVCEYHCCILKENKEKEYKLMLFFSGTEYLFVQEAGERRWISKTYITTRDLRSEAFTKSVGEIAWVHTEDIAKV